MISSRCARAKVLEVVDILLIQYKDFSFYVKKKNMSRKRELVFVVSGGEVKNNLLGFAYCAIRQNQGGAVTAAAS